MKILSKMLAILVAAVIAISALACSPDTGVTARNDSATTPMNTAVRINVLVGPGYDDSHCEHKDLWITGAWDTNHGGTVSVASDSQSILYTPATGFVGTETFKYSIKNTHNSTAQATVTVTVTAPPNRPPVADDDSATINQNESVTIDVLHNDSDPDGDTPLTVTIVSGPSHGSVSVLPGGDVYYTPVNQYSGGDSFVYSLSDGHGGSDTANVVITIGNRPPVADDDSGSTHPSVAVTIPVLSNDSDPDGNSFSITAVTDPAHGSVTTVSGGIRYTPNGLYIGTDSFNYTIRDIHGGEDSATVTVTISNHGPDARDDAEDTYQNESVNVYVLVNDVDADGDTLTITGVSAPQHGTAYKSGTYIVYQPAAEYFSSDWFTYTISDGHGGEDTATVTITIKNRPPVAQNDAKETLQNTPVDIPVFGNDSDPENDHLTVVNITGLTHGTAVGNAAGITYTPNSGFYGIEQFTYTISDGHGNTASALVTVTINGLPDAVNDVDETMMNTPVTVPVLLNDTDPEHDPLTITGKTAPSYGTAVMDGNQIRYTPNSGFHGTDAFTYTISDGRNGTDTATVTITVNAPPNAVDDSATTQFNTAIAVSVLSNDTDPDSNPLTIVSKTSPSHGTAVIEGSRIRYTPVSGYYGTDTFTYTISDGRDGTDTATVTIKVNAPPDAVNDSVTIAQNSYASISVLSNDSDLNGDALTVTSVTAPAHGTATIEGSNVRYTPATGYYGTDTFNYTISDGDGGTDTATVTITINRLNTPPVAVNDSMSTYQNIAVSIPVVYNDYDVNGDTLTITYTTPPSHGTILVQGSSIIYTPAYNYTGTDTFTYTISDGFGGSATATVYVSVGYNMMYVPTVTPPTYVYSGTSGYSVQAPQEISDTQSNSIPVTGNVPLNPILLLVILLGGLSVLLLYLRRKQQQKK